MYLIVSSLVTLVNNLVPSTCWVQVEEQRLKDVVEDLNVQLSHGDKVSMHSSHPPP